MHSMAKMKEGMLEVDSRNHVWGGITASELHQLYSELLPTLEKIASMLSANSADREEKRVFSFLRRYVRTLNQVDAVTFLRWITGSETLTVNTIVQVEFHKSSEEEPYPRAHVCGAILDISSRGYNTYQKFQQIMNSVIGSEEAFKFASV